MCPKYEHLFSLQNISCFRFRIFNFQAFPDVLIRTFFLKQRGNCSRLRPSVLLHVSPKPFDEIQFNLVCDLFTPLLRACNS